MYGETMSLVGGFNPLFRGKKIFVNMEIFPKLRVKISMLKVWNHHLGVISAWYLVVTFNDWPDCSYSDLGWKKIIISLTSSFGCFRCIFKWNACSKNVPAASSVEHQVLLREGVLATRFPQSHYNKQKKNKRNNGNKTLWKNGLLKSPCKWVVHIIPYIQQIYNQGPLVTPQIDQFYPPRN